MFFFKLFPLLTAWTRVETVALKPVGWIEAEVHENMFKRAAFLTWAGCFHVSSFITTTEQYQCLLLWIYVFMFHSSALLLLMCNFYFNLLFHILLHNFELYPLFDNSTRIWYESGSGFWDRVCMFSSSLCADVHWLQHPINIELDI